MYSNPILITILFLVLAAIAALLAQAYQEQWKAIKAFLHHTFIKR